ncbi:hypothetical protein BJV78DRAFT_1220976, partial [Lactifluus subvellereus]
MIVGILQYPQHYIVHLCISPGSLSSTPSLTPSLRALAAALCSIAAPPPPPPPPSGPSTGPVPPLHYIYLRYAPRSMLRRLVERALLTDSSAPGLCREVTHGPSRHSKVLAQSWCSLTCVTLILNCPILTFPCSRSCFREGFRDTVERVLSRYSGL